MSKLRAVNLLNQLEQNWLIDAIKTAEKNSSGEIRVHLEDTTQEDCFDRAAEVFAALNMHQTQNRNGVLIYVEVCAHNFVILGDIGFNHLVDDSFWGLLCDQLSNSFSKGLYFEGLAKCIYNVGKQMNAHFPLSATNNNPNELPNSISFG